MREVPISHFTCDDQVRMKAIGTNRFQLEVSADGGGIRLHPSEAKVIDWTEYDYMHLNIHHESHDVLVIRLTFQDEAARSITVHFGVLPGVMTKLCLPLSALSGERLFLPRFPGVLQTVLRGDSSMDRTKIESFSLSTIPSTGKRTFEVSHMALSKNVPEFTYHHSPSVDKLGQMLGREWKTRTASEEEMKARTIEELQSYEALQADQAGFSSYGGWKGIGFESTGYFRTEYDGNRWWFVDPDGYALFSTGMDCVTPYDPMHITGMEHLIGPLPEREDEFGDAWGTSSYSYQVANMMRVFGNNWRQRWEELTEHRLKDWGFNTIGNWSDPSFIRRSSLPYVYPMDSFPTTKETIYRDFPDVFSEEYATNAEAFASQLKAMSDDRRLIGYFMRNEPHWAFVDGLNLTELMLRSPRSFASKRRFVEWIREKYTDVRSLNEAWGVSLADFDNLLSAPFMDSPHTAASKEDYAAFNRILIRRYVEVPSLCCKKAAPHHLNMGMRYAWVANDDILEGCEAFDVFSINCYQMKPDSDLINRISQKLNRPVMIGEFHFGAADSGLPAYGIRAVATQEERAQAYRYFLEQAAALPALIGVHYFQLNDQPALGRFDGENYQIGVVDVCLRPYELFVKAMKEAHSRMYLIRTGKLEPASECPEEIPKTGF